MVSQLMTHLYNVVTVLLFYLMYSSLFCKYQFLAFVFQIIM